MPLLFNLHQLEAKNLRLAGELPVQELELEQVDELIHPRQPLYYSLEAQQLADGILVQGQLKLSLECECARCLKPFECLLVLERWACHLPLEGEEKVLVVNDSVDLTPWVREDILLAYPQHPLCKPECGGLVKKPTGQLKTPGGSKSKEVSSPWAELNKLKL